MTVPTWTDFDNVLRAIDHLRKQTCDLAEKVAEDVARLEQRVEALTVEVEQLKQGQFGPEPDPNSFTGKRAGLDPTYDWWVVDSSGRGIYGKWHAEGTTDSLDDAVSTGRLAMAQVSPILHPCVLRVRERKVVVEVSSDGGDRTSSSEPDPDTDPVYHWEVRDMEDQFQAGGWGGTLHEAMSNARSYAYQYAPCRVRVWTEKTVHEATFDD